MHDFFHIDNYNYGIFVMEQCDIFFTLIIIKCIISININV
jgi:hypothetical protein